LVLFALVTGCGSNKDEKKDTSPIPKTDSAVAIEQLPSIEKEFADTVSTKPVKDSVLLKFNFQKGKIYNYTMTIDLSQKKGELSRGTDMKWNYDMKVIDEQKKLKTIEATYRQIDMTVNMGNDQKMEFSSEKKVDAMDFMQLPSKMFNIIKGKSFTMQINEKGQVVSVSGFDKIGEAVVSEMTLPDQMKPMMRQNFQKQFNDSSVKQMFSQSFDALPNKYIKIGDSWKTGTEISAMKQNISTIYTVKNIKGSRVYLTGDSKLNSNDGKNSGSQKSQLIIDSKTGLMIDGVFDQKSSDGNMNSKTRIVGKEF
jgi:hypothetical protein